MEQEQIVSACKLCPRSCGVDRLNGQTGYCRETAELVVARAALHMWEEPCISGEKGSGTVFFSGCPLGCVFCQNRTIATGETGKKITVERLAEIFLSLEEQGANNINLVTPTHYIVPIAEALRLAKKQGLSIPIVYNSSGYELVSSLQLLDGLVDIYLPDFKYYSPELAKRYANAANYPECAKAAIEEMFSQVGTPVFDEHGIMQKGMIVRHLILPGNTTDSKAIIKYLYETYKDDIYISIMNQFTPMPILVKYPEINRTLTEEEYDEVVDYAIDLGVENGFIQEGETAKESFIPPFNLEGV